MSSKESVFYCYLRWRKVLQRKALRPFLLYNVSEDNIGFCNRVELLLNSEAKFSETNPANTRGSGKAALPTAIFTHQSFSISAIVNPVALEI